MTTAELAEALRPVIKEVVKETMQSELREILTEAVEIASRPSNSGSEDSFEIEDTSPVVKPSLRLEKPDWVQELQQKQDEFESKLSESKKQAKQDIQSEAQKNIMMGLLAETSQTMTAEDRSNFG